MAASDMLQKPLRLKGFFVFPGEFQQLPASAPASLQSIRSATRNRATACRIFTPDAPGASIHMAWHLSNPVLQAARPTA